MCGEVLLLRRSDVARLLPIRECIDVVEEAFRKYALGELPAPGVLAAHTEQGGFHIKTAMSVDRTGRYFAAKANANFPSNPARLGLPTIQGLVLLFDAANGRPLAVLDSIELTIQRTAAATAIAAKHLARAGSRTLAVCGCGAQALAQLAAIRAVLPIERCLAFDLDATHAHAFADTAASLGMPSTVASDLAGALAVSDVVVTCTPSRRPFIGPNDVRPGTFIAAVGADNPDKQELDPALLARSTVVVDVLEQCAAIGELHHALDAGVMTRGGVYAELGSLVAGRAPGRQTRNEITVFDSTGAALQDAAAAAAVYAKAVQEQGFQAWAAAG
jgi:alanine dehydrogenase